MALKKCKECGKEISSDAKVCPNCGKKQPNIRRNIGCLILFAIFLIPFLIIIYSSKKVPQKPVSRAKKDLIVSKPELKSQPKLELLEWSWRTEYDYAIVEGRVKNVSDINLKNVEAVIVFKTKDGNFITSSTALIEYNPILPSQVSPFKVMEKYNPAMDTANIDFKTLFGGTISWSKKK